LALALGLAVAELVAGLLGRAESAVTAVGEEFIDITPAWLKELAIDWFGTSDKAVLVGGIMVVLAILGVGVGLLTARRYGLGMMAAVALLAIAAGAVWRRPDTTAADLVPIVAGGVIALPALSWLTRKAVADAVVTGGRAAGPSRRTFVTAASITAVLAAAGGGVGRWLRARRAGVEQSRDDLATSINFPSPEPPAGVDAGVTGVESWRTANDDFYRIDTALAPPLLPAKDWRLRVHGMVEREIELGFDRLIGMGLVSRWLTLNCVSNEVGGHLIGNALWTGVPIAKVLALAGPLSDADAVLSRSDDGWTAGTPLNVLTDGRGALLAVGMNGEPLPIEHGFPVRMIVPGLYGYVSATKWVVDLEVSRFAAFDAYWTSRGWAEQGPVKVASRIDVPQDRSSVHTGTVAVAGVAWAQHRGISGVQVRVDETEWASARLADVPSTDTWRQWMWQWNASPGDHILEVRATTQDGEVQTGEQAPPPPDGATGWHRIEVGVV
jgi:DMSO/TMAO reductase YedYZ molybdopterin-dependent catalytic subunit